MKKANKALLLALCAILLVAGSIMGTLAYLTSNATVENTFTAGNVKITMTEAKVDAYGKLVEGAARVTGNEYKLVPGHTYTKDPTIYVDANSEDCYIFVKIENGLGTDASIAMNAGWTKVEGVDGVWMCNEVQNANDAVTPFSTFTFGNNANPATYATAKITVTAYAIQADTLDGMTPAQIWGLFNV